MKNFISIKDVNDLPKLIDLALELKKDIFKYRELGIDKTLGLFFFNPSLRTRFSTHKAGRNLGMEVITVNADKDNWALEFMDGAVMDGTKAEHIREAAPVIGKYCDIIGIRSFPGLTDKEFDENDTVINSFLKYSDSPIVSLESATGHPLQSFADMVTIHELREKSRKPKVVLNWAPHIKAIPHSVSNSFAEWANVYDCDFVITHPEGYELHPKYTGDAPIIYNQEEALKDADFVYIKNWSCYSDYGKILPVNENWMLDKSKLDRTNNAKIMHCLPVRRNVELSDYALDSENSVVTRQAENRIYAAQAVLTEILRNM